MPSYIESIYSALNPENEVSRGDLVNISHWQVLGTLGGKIRWG